MGVKLAQMKNGTEVPFLKFLNLQAYLVVGDDGLEPPTSSL